MDPDQYNKFSKIRENHSSTYIPKYKHWIQWNPKGKDTILDIGSQTGTLTKDFIYPLLPGTFSKLVLSDRSQKMVDHAKKLFEGDSKVSCEILDISRELDEKEKNKLGSFDHIFSQYHLAWLPNHQKCFENIYNLLSPGGDCFLILTAGSLYMDVTIELNSKARWKKFVPNPEETHPFPYSRDPNPVKTVTEMMESIGFVNINVKLEKSLIVFNTTEEFLGFMKSQPNPLESMSVTEQEDYLKQAADLAISHNSIGEISDRKQNDTVSEILVVYGRKN
ncbi:Methyltransf_12 domain-containing protein [Sergentomyia squamirostris]